MTKTVKFKENFGLGKMSSGRKIKNPNCQRHTSKLSQSQWKWWCKMFFIHYICLLPSEHSSPLGHSLKDKAGDSWSRYFCSHRCWIRIQSISTGLHTLMDILWCLTSTERSMEGRYAGAEISSPPLTVLERKITEPIQIHSVVSL